MWGRIFFQPYKVGQNIEFGKKTEGKFTFFFFGGDVFWELNVLLWGMCNNFSFCGD